MLKNRVSIILLALFLTAAGVQTVWASQGFTPGDGVRISVFPETDHFLNGVYPIDMEGYVTLPLVGRVQVSSFDNHQFTDFLQVSFQQYLRYPEVQVTKLMRVSLLGGFAEPGMYYIEPQRSLWDLVHMAGGPSYEKGLRNMRWERNRRVLRRDLIPLLESGVSLNSAGFRSGDQVWAPSEPGNTFWSAVVRDVVIRDLLPIATFMLSLYVSLATIRN